MNIKKVFASHIILTILFITSISVTTSAYGDDNMAGLSCPVEGETMSKVELYFGLNIPGGGRVSPDEWQNFVDKEVTPRFPDGLTIDKVSGQWQDVKTSNTIQEPSRVIMILYKPSEKSERAIETIRQTYKS